MKVQVLDPGLHEAEPVGDAALIQLPFGCLELATKTITRLVVEAAATTCATAERRSCSAAGVPIAQVSKMLGHSSITINLTYSHLREGVGRAAADAADALVPMRKAAPQPRDQSVATPRDDSALPP